MFKLNKTNLEDTYILEDLVITPPEPQTLYISVPGRNGSLDLTDSLYGTKYQDREISASFIVRSYDVDDYNILLSKYHGKSVVVNLSDDYYFVGRATLSQLLRVGNIGKFSLSIKCEPYRLKEHKTKIVKDIVTKEIFTLTNEQMPTTLIIKTSATINLEYENTSTTLTKGTYRLPMVLNAGSNNLTVTGTAKIEIEYQEGAL